MGKSPKENDKDFNRTILKWTLLGLLIRFLIMPFTMHTFDLFFIYYFPFQLIDKGVWDIYRFIPEHFPGFHLIYYGPVAYFLIAFFLFFLKFFLPELGNAFELFEGWFFTSGGGTVHYASFLGESQLFRMLFLFKTPYLIFDFATAFFLVKLAHNQKEGLFCYRLWMLNPLFLHSVYAIGQLEAIPIFLTVAALYWASVGRSDGAVICLILGGLVKVYPFFLVPIVVFLSSRDFKERMRLFGLALVTLLLILLPFYFSSGGTVMDCIMVKAAVSQVVGGTFRRVFFILAYFFLLLYAHRMAAKRENAPILNQLFLLVFLFYALLGLIKFRYFAWLSPFLILAISRDRRLGWFCLILLVLMAEVHLSGNQVQWGLLDPVYPTFFASLPISDSFLVSGRFPLGLIQQISYRFSLVILVTMIYRVWKWQRVS